MSEVTFNTGDMAVHIPSGLVYLVERQEGWKLHVSTQYCDGRGVWIKKYFHVNADQCKKMQENADLRAKLEAAESRANGLYESRKRLVEWIRGTRGYIINLEDKEIKLESSRDELKARCEKAEKRVYMFVSTLGEDCYIGDRLGATNCSDCRNNKTCDRSDGIFYQELKAAGGE